MADVVAAVEAERLMQRAVREIEDRGGKGDSLDDENLQRVCGFAVRLAKLVGSATWLSWALDLYKKHRAMPSDGVMAELGRIDFQNNAELRSVWIGYARFLETLPGGQVKARSLSVYSG